MKRFTEVNEKDLDENADEDFVQAEDVDVSSDVRPIVLPFNLLELQDRLDHKTLDEWYSLSLD